MDFFFQKKGFSPDTFGAKEVLGIFQKSGSIAEVVILSKGDQCGQQFGSHGSEFLVTGACFVGQNKAGAIYQAIAM
jgi:hypothetical protein